MTRAPLSRPRIMVVFGTRPEAIKMAPVVAALRAHDTLDVRVVVTAQHRALLDQVLAIAGIAPDIDLDLMQAGQSLHQLAARIVTALGEAIARERPDRLIVHGDTLTTMAASLAAYLHRVPVAHVEAGLRSGDLLSPWPEEGNRRLTGVLTDLHFAPTEQAAAALRAENVAPDTIHVTGNTVIDALLAMRARIARDPALAAGLDSLAARFAGKRIIGVTTHRRENFGDAMAQVARAIEQIAAREDVAVIFPVHPNPAVRPVMTAALGAHPRIALIDPLDYPHFVRLMAMSHVMLTDSGGVQEEAPSLGVPVLVMRDTTERPEGVAAGTAALVGTDADTIVNRMLSLLDDDDAHAAMARAHNPYGDGRAAERIARIVEHAHRPH
ncbi:non-hydrolyzing UDP-N-acetylglucosamine 2-epimerase [Sphingomonas sp.]|uniref:non-hydrolyzing UDP-N-acetylglucosamine 2-epimerase n=1 Tax=Sphingomonas sp. TaxID=28214 RepID=UPI0035C7E0CF